MHRPNLLIASAGISLLLSDFAHADSLADQILDGISAIKYGSDSKFALGDSFSVIQPAAPKERCLDFDQEKGVKSDTNGAVASSLRVSMVRNLEEFEKTTNFSFSTSAHAGAKLGSVFDISGDINQNGKFDNFVHNERQSLLIILEAMADQGRDYIWDYKLKEEYAELLKQKKIKEFVARCGTHFIRGVAKKSGVRLTLSLENLTESSKRLISYHFDTTSSGKFGIKELTADAKSTLTTDISDTLKLASNFGKVSYDVQSTGGDGVSTLGKFLKGIDLSKANLEDIRKTVDAIAEASADFTAKNAAPDRYVLVPYAGLDESSIDFDEGRFKTMGLLYKAIIRSDSLLSTYRKYKEQSPAIWSKYFKVYDDKIANLREAIQARYISCKSGGECSTDIPQKIDGLVLDDLFFDGSLAANCPLGNAVISEMNSKTDERFDYISSIQLEWLGQARFTSDIDRAGIEAFRITPDLRVEDLKFNASRQFTLNAASAGRNGNRVLINIAHISPDMEKFFRNKIVDLNYLRDFRKDAARSVYYLKVPLTSGLSVEEVLGYPDMQKCKLVEEQLDVK